MNPCLQSLQKSILNKNQATFFILDHVEPNFLVFFINNHLTTRKFPLLHHKFLEVDDVRLDISLEVEIFESLAIDVLVIVIQLNLTTITMSRKSSYVFSTAIRKFNRSSFTLPCSPSETCDLSLVNDFCILSMMSMRWSWSLTQMLLMMHRIFYLVFEIYSFCSFFSGFWVEAVKPSSYLDQQYSLKVYSIVPFYAQWCAHRFYFCDSTSASTAVLCSFWERWGCFWLIWRELCCIWDWIISFFLPDLWNCVVAVKSGRSLSGSTAVSGRVLECGCMVGGVFLCCDCWARWDRCMAGTLLPWIYKSTLLK